VYGKSEIRNKFKSFNSQKKNKKRMKSNSANSFVSRFFSFDFGFVSDFGFRISDFPRRAIRFPDTARRRQAFTLLEMLTTVAALVIVLGLMVSLARRVRDASAVDLTKDLLRRLDGLMDQYEARYHRLPDVAAFIDPKTQEPNEKDLQRTAVENNRQVLLALKLEVDDANNAFNGVPDAIYNEAMLRDAWGTPIVFMPSLNPAIGMAPQNRRFFFSAGPDRQFLTQEDNLYSYEEGNLTPGTGNPKSPSTDISNPKHEISSK
jgi:type II secretory pathway pseudopilin PulG